MRKQLLQHLIVVAAGCLVVLLWLLHGAARHAPPSPPPVGPPDPALTAAQQAQVQRCLALEAERKEADQSIWAPELLAGKHEDVFIGLWDGLRTSSEPEELLAQFPFGTLIMGEPGETNLAAHGIRLTRLRGPGQRLVPPSWRQMIQSYKTQGYRLVSSEWRHAAFEPGADGRARSTFAIMLQIANPERQERVVVRGPLRVTWKESRQPDRAPVAEQIDATGLELLAQSGPPAFERILDKDIPTRLHPIFIDPLIVSDLNGDGLSEIILVGQNLVYWNHGHGEFQAGQLCAEPVASISTAALADFTGDGWPDLLAADPEGLILFRGDGKGPFTAPPERIRFTETELPNPFVMAVGDVNGDGALDVWLAQDKLPYVAGQMPTPFYDANDGSPSFLLLNDGHGGFRDATGESGLARKRFRRTHSASLVDLDHDGDLDLIVVSDFAGVDLYLNDGRGHFTDVTETALDESRAFGMAHSFGDYDLDGQLDFLVMGMNSYTGQRLDQLGLGPTDFPDYQAVRPKMAYGNRLYMKRGDAWQETPLSGQVARSGWSWGVTSFDFDNDGAQDLYIANGYKSRASAKDYDTQFWRHDIYVARSTPDPALDLYFRGTADRLYGAGWSYGGYEHNRLFLNQGGKSLLEMGFLAGVALPQDCRNVVSDDLDNDGQLDLIVTTLAAWPEPRQALHVFRNRLQDPGHWIGFHLREGGPGFSPVGARITVTTPSGEQFRQIVTGDSYRSQHATTAHFGLGKETQVNEAAISWPNGTIQRLPHPNIDQYHEVARPP